MELTTTQAENLGAAMKHARLAIRMRQEDAARVAGVSLATWRSAETARAHSVSERTLMGVMAALNWDQYDVRQALAGDAPGLVPSVGQEIVEPHLVPLLRSIRLLRSEELGQLEEFVASLLRTQQDQLTDSLYEERARSRLAVEEVEAVDESSEGGVQGVS